MKIRLDSLIAERCPDWPRSQIKKAIDSGSVTVNGEICTKAGRLCSGTENICWDRPETVDAAHPTAQSGIDCSIVYEDEHIAVINKPAGLVVHPGAGHLDGTLVNALLARYPEMANVGSPERPGIVHRLDADTSGLLIAARSQTAWEILTEMFAAHKLHRIYHAVCFAPKLPDFGRFDTYYGRHPVQRIKYTSKGESDKRAVTDYRVAQRAAGGFAIVCCRLETGRTHQVRVHLSEHGAPIVGDALYAPKNLAASKIISRTALHARFLVFAHPISGKICTFDAPYPTDFKKALQKLGFDADAAEMYCPDAWICADNHHALNADNISKTDEDSFHVH